jgi:hypothetical protein
MQKKYLQRIILILITILGIKTGVETFVSSINMHSNETAVISWDERVSNLIARIPFKRGVIGYISNADIPGATFNQADSSGEYILTQYAAIPLVIIRGTNQEWNILNIDPKTFEKWQQTNGNEFEITGSGGGLYLAHKVSK